jgi:DNA modification methylase
MAEYVFKLRSNIDLEGDLNLAAMELESLLGTEVAEVAVLSELDRDPLAELRGFEAPGSHTRAGDVEGYTAEAPLTVLPDLIRRCSFVQRIYCLTGADERDRLADISQAVGPVVRVETHENRALGQAIPHYALFEIADVVARRSTGPAETKENLTATLASLLGRGSEGDRLVEDALTMKNTSSLLSHDVHYYKAKFFPRLARAILNVYGEGATRVLDNFVGSGTSLLESSLLGTPSVGFDIDPLSVRISRTKLRALSYPSAALAESAHRLKDEVTELTAPEPSVQARIDEFDGDSGGTEVADVEPITFPDWLLSNRKMTDERATELGETIARLRHAVEEADPRFRELFRILLSDAISRKIKFRFLGTGVGRFSLTFTKTPMADTFCSMLETYVKVAAVSEWVRDHLHVESAPGAVARADAGRLPAADESVDFLLTSPPYLPASSGRESYAKARAPALIALGLFDPDEIADLAGDAIGSMAPDGLPLAELTDQERALVEWLRDDDLREIKAAPTAQYFLDIREAFGEMRRVLEPGATAVVVCGKQSTFYESESREPLYVAEAAEMVAEEARIAGLEVQDRHDVQLQKPNSNARPRSLDDYYETLIVLRKPAE